MKPADDKHDDKQDIKPATPAPADATEPTETVTYDPPPDEAQEVTWRGVLFKAGEAVKVRGREFIEAARANRQFKVGGRK